MRQRIRRAGAAVFVAFTLVPTAGGAADGSALFDQHCLACHGPDARGINGLGADLVDSRFVRGASQAALVEFLKQGRLPDDPASVTGRPMPGFSWVADGELLAIAAFLKAQGGND